MDNDLYHFPSEAFLTEDTYIISFVPEGDYNFSYWDITGIEFASPKDEFDNPTLISINGTGEVTVYYEVGTHLDISRGNESYNPIFTDSPCNLTVQVTANEDPVMNVEVTFYVGSESIGSTETDSEGYASIIFVPDEEKVYSLYVTAKKIGYGTGYSDEWQFAFQKVNIDPVDNEVLTELPINLNALVELDGEPVEDAIVSYHIDDKYRSDKRTQPNGFSTYQMQYITAGVHSWHVLVQISGWEPITSETHNFSYTPQLSASLEYPKNNEVITDYTSTVNLRAFVTSSNRPFQSGNVSFYVGGEYQGSSMSDAEGYASYDFTPSEEDVTYSWHVSTSEPHCINDTSTTWSFYYPVQPPYVEVDEVYTSKGRADIDSEQIIGFHLRWENGSDVRGTFVRITDNHEGETDDSGWVTFTVSSPDVGEKNWKIIEISCEGMGEFRHDDYPKIVWDRVSVELSLDNHRVDIGSSIEPTVNAFYEYDNTAFEGSLFYNTEFYSGEVCEKTIEVEDMVDHIHGLSAFRSDEVTVIWDKVLLSLEISEGRVQVGTEPEITFSGLYEYDQIPFEGSIVYDDDLRQNILGEKNFGVLEISDSLHNLSVFKFNRVSCIFDDIEIEQQVDAVIPTQVQVLTTIHWKSDHEPVEDALVKVNGVGEHIRAGEYRATVYTFYPFLRLNTEIKIEDWEIITVEENIYTLGNIISEALLIVVLGSISIREVYNARKRAQLKREEK